jgi:hypothetical protein
MIRKAGKSLRKYERQPDLLHGQIYPCIMRWEGDGDLFPLVAPASPHNRSRRLLRDRHCPGRDNPMIPTGSGLTPLLHLSQSSDPKNLNKLRSLNAQGRPDREKPELTFDLSAITPEEAFHEPDPHSLPWRRGE